MKYQNLLEIKDNKLSGPMSPVLFIKDMAKELNFKISGLCRLWNPQSNSGYDHLITVQKFKNCNQYMMFIDTGCAGIPVGTYFSDEENAILTPIYKKHITPEAQQNHRWNCEIQNQNDNPVIMLNEKELKNIFIKADKGGYLTPKQ